MNYTVRVDKAQHCVLMVEAGPKFTTFIARDKKKIDLFKLPNAEFSKQYCFEYEGYSTAEFAKRLLSNASLGYQVTTRAKAHLTNLHKETPMAKLTKTDETAAAPAEKAKKAAPAATAEKAAPAPKTATAPVLPKDKEFVPRQRRDGFDGSARIKKIGENPARQGTIRHAIIDTILQARTVQEALDSSVERKDKSECKIGLPDLYFALDNKVIEIL